MSSGYYAHNIDDISDDCKVLNISLLQGRTVNSHCFCDLTVCVVRALKPRLGQFVAAL
jgi:hypothetical protein